MRFRLRPKKRASPFSSRQSFHQIRFGHWVTELLGKPFHRWVATFSLRCTHLGARLRRFFAARLTRTDVWKFAAFPRCADLGARLRECLRPFRPTLTLSSVIVILRFCHISSWSHNPSAQ